MSRNALTIAPAVLLLAFVGCGQPDLYELAAADDVASVEQALADGAQIDARDERGWTLLHHAAAGSAHGVVKLLLDRGADIDAVAQQDLTPLHIAVVESGLETVRLLVTAGARLDMSALDGVTAQQLAARRGDHEVAAYLAGISDP